MQWLSRKETHMKMQIVAGILTFSAVQPLLGSLGYASNHGDSAEGQSHIPTPEERETDLKEFMGLRQFWFSVKPSEANIKPSAEFPNIFSIIMDWPIQRRTNGIVRVMVGALSDGSSSLYITPGSQVFGGYSARDEALLAIKETEQIYPSAKSTTATPLPPPDQIYFYMRSYKGLFVLREKQSDLLHRRGKALPLFEAMNRIMTIHLDSIEREMKPKISFQEQQDNPEAR